MIRPSGSSGANTAERVPTTTSTSPRRMRCHWSWRSPSDSPLCWMATRVAEAARGTAPPPAASARSPAPAPARRGRAARTASASRRYTSVLPLPVTPCSSATSKRAGVGERRQRPERGAPARSVSARADVVVRAVTRGMPRRRLRTDRDRRRRGWVVTSPRAVRRSSADDGIPRSVSSGAGTPVGCGPPAAAAPPAGVRRAAAGRRRRHPRSAERSAVDDVEPRRGHASTMRTVLKASTRAVSPCGGIAAASAAPGPAR